MNENNRRPRQPIQIIRSENTTRTPIREILSSPPEAEAFWWALPVTTRRDIEASITPVESALVRTRQEGHRSPHVKRMKQLHLFDETERQLDDESCSYIALANALRVLDRPRPEYTLRGLKTAAQRVQNKPPSYQISERGIRDLFDSEQPFSRFTLSRVTVDNPGALDPIAYNRTLLDRFDEGAIGLTDWAFSPHHTEAHGIDFTHTRTIAGYSVSDGKIFFHVVDPYQGREKPWSFKDLTVAYTFQMPNSLGNPALLAANIELVDLENPIQTVRKTGE